MFSPPLLGQRRLNMLWEQPAHWPLESPLPVGSATPRATSTSSPPILDNGALFALTASLPMTPTLSANNLGFPEPESSTAGGNRFGAVPSPFRILSGIEPVPVVMGSTGA